MNYRFQLFRVLSVVVFLCAGCDTNDSTSRVPAYKIADKTTILATIIDAGIPKSVDPSLSMGLHSPQAAAVQPIFSTHGGGAAYSAEKDDKVYVVHNNRAGKLYDAVGAIALSPDGRRIAYGALVAGKWHMVIDGIEGAAFSTVKSPVYSPDGGHLAYQAMSGEKWYLVIDTNVNAGTNTRFLDHQFSSDSTKIAYLDNSDVTNYGRLVISDLLFTRQTIIGLRATRLIVSHAEAKAAAITFRDNKQQIVECSFDRPDVIKAGPQYTTIHSPSFSLDGAALAYSADHDGKRFMVLDDREEALPDGWILAGEPVVHPDRKKVGAIFSANGQVFFYVSFLDSGQKENSYDEADGLVFNNDGSKHAYAARKGNRWFIVVNGVEGAEFDRVISPKFSPNGKYLVYRARKDGKRFVVIANKTGKIIRKHPAYEQIFEVEFTSDGKSVAYGVKDGQNLVWRVETL